MRGAFADGVRDKAGNNEGSRKDEYAQEHRGKTV